MELKLISLFGWLVMLAAAWAISFNRKNFPSKYGTVRPTLLLN